MERKSYITIAMEKKIKDTILFEKYFTLNTRPNT